MFCIKCEEVPDNELLKHLREYHEGEKDLNIVCPGCSASYSNVTSFQSHWYKKHHTKRKLPDACNPTTSGDVKKMRVSEPSPPLQSDVEPSIATDVIDSNNGVQQHDATASRSVCEQMESAQPTYPSTSNAASSSLCDHMESDQSTVPFSSADDVQTESESESDNGSGNDSDYGIGLSDDGSDEEGEGMGISEAIKCAQPQTKLPPVNLEAASYLLNLNSACNIPYRSTELVIAETEKIIKSSILNFASRVNEKLKNSNTSLEQIMDVESVAQSVSKVFDDIRSVKQQKKQFKAILGLVEAKPLPLGRVLRKVRRKGHPGLKTVVKEENLMLIPISETLDKLINHPDYKGLIDRKEDSEFLDSFMKGEKCKTNAVLIKHPNGFRFILYYDDLEVCAPLKTKAGNHKLGAFYLLLDNIALKHRSNLSLIFLVALVNANFVKDKKYGMDAALEVIVGELQKFERGVVLPSGPKVYGTLIATIGDNLGSHAIGGFKEGFTAHCCCRYCMATYEQCQRMVRQDSKLMRTPEAHAKQCAEIQTVRGKNEKNSTKYGVNRDSALNALKSYHVVEGLPADAMHDLLEGVLPLQIKRLLNHFLEEKDKKFELDWLNAAILDFDYGYAEAADKPSEIKKDHLKEDSSLHQSAVQTWLLAIILPLIIGPLLSKGDVHFENFLELLDICRVVFSTDVSPWMVPYLGDMIEEYLENFISLYGNLIPKQHYLLHFPWLISLFGSLVNYMCLRCEAKHKFFKKFVYILGNYKNIPLSLSNKHQLHMAATWNKSLVKEATCGPCHLVNLDDSGYKRMFPGVNGNVIETNWLIYNGDKFKPDNCFLCIGFEDYHPIFVKLFKVLVHPTLQLLCEKVLTVRRSIYLAAYEVEVLSGELQIVKIESLAMHNIMHAHKVEGSFYIAMKYIGGGIIL